MSDRPEDKPAQAAPAPGAAAVEPGRLTNTVRMSIHTRIAQRLVLGRRADPDTVTPAIVGLYRYGAMTRQLWGAASKDDPYADWWLLRIEHCITDVREQMVARRAQVDALLKTAPSINVALAHTEAPVGVELAFGNPYAYQGAYLLADLDELVLAIMTVRFVGLMDREAFERHIDDAGRGVRRLFASIQGYRHLAVTRDDVRQNTQKGQRAAELMGALPTEVLEGELRAAHAPVLRATQSPSPAPEDAPSDDSAEAEKPTDQENK